MRPRHEGRGERQRTPAIGLARVKLQCGHGTKAVENPSGRRPRSPIRIGFNAATARRPWRTVDPRRRAYRQRTALQCGHGTKAVENSTVGCHAAGQYPSGFNAATARRPWRTRAGASSAPRGALLQCGHGTKAVENASPSDSAKLLYVELQCGHGTKAVENTRDAVRSVRRLVASMRPRHEGRGELGHHEGIAAHRRSASMRPRHEGRGERRCRRMRLAVGPDASMRPRHEGRGEPEAVIAKLVNVRQASMRPRHEGRGEPSGRLS